jgi:hypothetical protein
MEKEFSSGLKILNECFLKSGSKSFGFFRKYFLPTLVISKPELDLHLDPDFGSMHHLVLRMSWQLFHGRSM